jgi:hypothetical protein
MQPVSVAVQSKMRRVLGRWNIGIMGSNSARGMDVCLRFFFRAVLYRQRTWDEPFPF